MKKQLHNRYKNALFGSNQNQTLQRAHEIKDQSIYIFDNKLNTVKKPFQKLIHPQSMHPPRGIHSNGAQLKSNSKTQNEQHFYVSQTGFDSSKQSGQQDGFYSNRGEAARPRRASNNMQPKRIKSYDYLLDNSDWLGLGLLDRHTNRYNDCLMGYYGTPNTYLPQKVGYIYLDLKVIGPSCQWKRSF